MEPYSKKRFLLEMWNIFEVATKSGAVVDPAQFMDDLLTDRRLFLDALVG